MEDESVPVTDVGPAMFAPEQVVRVEVDNSHLQLLILF